MQIFIGDEFAETSALSPEEYGCHIHGELPTDDDRLRRICSAEKEQWPSIRDAIAPLFDWQWRHARTADLRRQSEELRQTKVENGKKGGRPRKADGKLNETDEKPIGKANGKADGKLNETPSPPPSPSHSQSKTQAPPAAHAPSENRAYDKGGLNKYMQPFPAPKTIDEGKTFLLSRGCPPEELKRCLEMLMEEYLTPYDIEAWDVKARANA
jgi:uncharacterized protein YdaU (DUF1376 family)